MQHERDGGVRTHAEKERAESGHRLGAGVAENEGVENASGKEELSEELTVGTRNAVGGGQRQDHAGRVHAEGLPAVGVARAALGNHARLLLQKERG